MSDENLGANEEVSTQLLDGFFNKLPKPSADRANGASADGAVPANGDGDVADANPDNLTPDDLLEDDAQEGPDDIDDALHEVRIDGQVSKVTLKQLRDSYSGEKFIEKRIQQATEAKTAAEQQAVQLYNYNQQQVARLQQLDKVLSDFAQPNIDWERLKQADPLQFALKREEMREMQDKQNRVRAEIDRVNAEQEQLYSQATENYLKDQADLLVSKLPDMSDPIKAKALMGRFTSAAIEYGFTEQELQGVMDHRALMVLHDAAKYRELVKRKAGNVSSVGPTKTMRTQNSKPASNTSKQREEATLKRAQSTGRPEDVAMTLLMHPNRRKV